MVFALLAALSEGAGEDAATADARFRLFDRDGALIGVEVVGRRILPLEVAGNSESSGGGGEEPSISACIEGCNREPGCPRIILPFLIRPVRSSPVALSPRLV